MPREWWRVRWGIFGCLFGFAIFGYVQRTGIAIAAARMVPELGLTQIELGGILNAFLISYTLLQLPGAMLGQWLGPRRTLGLVGIVSAAAACSTALVPAGEAGIAVLSPASLVDDVTAALTDAGIAFGVATRRGLEADVSVVPVDLAKGLELDGVVLVEPARILAEERQGLRALYVALTRSTKRLTIVHAQPLPEALVDRVDNREMFG